MCLQKKTPFSILIQNCQKADIIKFSFQSYHQTLRFSRPRPTESPPPPPPENSHGQTEEDLEYQRRTPFGSNTRCHPVPPQRSRNRQRQNRADEGHQRRAKTAFNSDTRRRPAEETKSRDSKAEDEIASILKSHREKRQRSCSSFRYILKI